MRNEVAEKVKRMVFHVDAAMGSSVFCWGLYDLELCRILSIDRINSSVVVHNACACTLDLLLYPHCTKYTMFTDIESPSVYREDNDKGFIHQVNGFNPRIPVSVTMRWWGLSRNPLAILSRHGSYAGPARGFEN